MPFRIKADGTMLIVAIDPHTTSKGESSAYKGKSISSACKGKITVDMPCPLVGCNPFIIYESICACSSIIVNNCLLLVFHRQFFFVRVPDIISKLNNKNISSQNKMSIKFYIPQWTVNNFRTNNMVTPCQKKRDMFLCSFHIN